MAEEEARARHRPWMPDRERSPGVARVVERNIEALLERREAARRARSREDRIADRITRFTGSLRFVYLHVALFAAWIGVNVLPTPLRFDPSLVILAMAASVEAIFLSTFVLISQNRMQAQADERADLDLQVSLLSEHEVTHLIHLVRQIADRMGIDDARDPYLAELEQDVAPEKVLDEMERNEARLRERGRRP